MSTPQVTEQKYRIGAVARLTGISPDTLRIWERRYSVVEPLRSPGGGREYSSHDVERLQLIKQLVDSGDAIGSIAGLDTETLRARAAQSFGPGLGAEGQPRQPCRIVVVGETIASAMEAAAVTLDGIELVAAQQTMSGIHEALPPEAADVLVIEIPTLHADTTREILGWLEETQARQALVVYRFAAAEALQRLPASRIQTVQAPVTPLVIRNLCTGIGASAVVAESLARDEEEGISLTVAPRRYSNEALSRLALTSPAIKCECPKHLAELITDLVAFERYSSECENRNLDDAALHAYLHATASNARNLIEEALSRVLEFEGIEIDAAEL